MNLLLVKFTDRAVEEVTIAAAGSWSSGAEVMNLLLDRRGEGVKVTEEVVRAAARNKSFGAEVMKLLLNRFSHYIKTK
ncbi:unnamed protein product [Colletotrichum noveboracense]|uniref:Uncharacterized protein n=1 Tax=Colletotrichum noveboracense TaxID=2664923 RepID=A0A9W4S3G6_9PEZI|nr:unnamed protein product [Colletotrichum noveboracense]